ncbi:MAG: class I adenylate-forming enzyme family protein [Pseudomonadota bacterium]
MGTLVIQLLEHANQRPAATAARDGEDVISYRQLADRALSFAQGLVQRGVVPGDRVVLLLSNSVDYIASLYGIWAASAIAVPLNPRSTASETSHVVAHTDARLVVVEDGSAASAGGNVHSVVAAPREFGGDLPALTRQTPAPAAEATAMMLFTSGTTADPKGVMLSHRALYFNARAIAEYLELSPADRAYCALPFQYSYGNSVLQSHIVAGASVHIAHSVAFPALMAEEFSDPSITGLSGVPSLFQTLLEKTPFAEAAGHLRYLTQAGGPMPVALTQAVAKSCPQSQLFLMYGQTEAAARLTYLDPRLVSQRPDSVGRALPGVELSISSPTEEDGVGELLARGPNIMQGYWRNPAATAHALRDGWLHTGDLARIDAGGFVYIVGRLGRQLKSGSYRIHPEEIEEVLSDLPFVAEAAIVGTPDDLLGSRLLACCVKSTCADESEPALTRRLMRHCADKLSPFKVPRSVSWMEALPKTESGKIRYHQLTQDLARDL